MMHLPDNPEGPLDAMKAGAMPLQRTADPDRFFDAFTTDFCSRSTDGALLVEEADRQRAIALCKQADRLVALEACSRVHRTAATSRTPARSTPRCCDS